MIESIPMQILSYALMAMLAENVIFSRGLGVERAVMVSDQRNILGLFGILTTICLIPTGIITYFASYYLEKTNVYLYAIRPLVYLGAMALTYLLVLWISSYAFSKKFGNLWSKIRITLHLAVFNSAVFGTLILCSTQAYTLAQTVGFCFGSGAGLAMATLYIYEGNRKLQNRNVPAAFKGMPVMLLYLGILSMCIYALTGYQLSF